MSSSALAVFAIFLEVLPGLCHRLITNPYPEQEWDSVIVSSDPITIRDKTHNATAPLTSNQILRPQKRSYDECPENDFPCLYGDDQHAKDSTRIVDDFFEQYSTHRDAQPDDHVNLTGAKDDENSRKSYWTMVDSQTHNHPFDDRKGWVTLDPVPWSTSKISKWHPNKVVIRHEGKPWNHGPTTQRPVQQFWVSESGLHPERPASQWGVGTNDIITDNKPSGFPTGHFHGYDSPNRGSHRPEGGSHEHPGDRNQYHHNYDLKGEPSYSRKRSSSLPLVFANDRLEIPGSHPNRMHQSPHPSTYPSNGNGEWVLLSTTKGYSHPQGHRWATQKNLKTVERVFASRKIKATDISKYHEEDLQEKFIRKSDDNGADNSTDDQKAPPQILYTASSKDGEPTTTFRRKIRLQVLPSLVSSSTSHGGLLEVDSNSQTVDEAQREDENVKKLKAIANVKKNKIRGYKLVPTSKITGKGMSQTNVVTLAAVGAGMIPATMALLVPMALGRRKRSLPEDFASRE